MDQHPPYSRIGDRFVRTAFQKTHIAPPSGKGETVSAHFHILEYINVPKGIVLTDRGTADYTQYTAMIGLSGPEYFFRTYDNSRMAAVRLPEDGAGGSGSSISSLGKLKGGDWWTGA